MLQASSMTSQWQTKIMLLIQGYWREFQKIEDDVNFCTYVPIFKVESLAKHLYLDLFPNLKIFHAILDPLLILIFLTMECLFTHRPTLI